MTKTKKMNSFSSSKYVEEIILDSDKRVIGTIRIKPSGILWKPSGKGSYLSVSLEVFHKWITDPNTRAKKISF